MYSYIFKCSCCNGKGSLLLKISNHLPVKKIQCYKCGGTGKKNNNKGVS